MINNQKVKFSFIPNTYPNNDFNRISNSTIYFDAKNQKIYVGNDLIASHNDLNNLKEITFLDDSNHSLNIQLNDGNLIITDEENNQNILANKNYVHDLYHELLDYMIYLFNTINIENNKPYWITNDQEEIIYDEKPQWFINNDEETSSELPSLIWSIESNSNNPVLWNQTSNEEKSPQWFVNNNSIFITDNSEAPQWNDQSQYNRMRWQ